MSYAPDELEKFLLGDSFPWYYHDGTVYLEDPNVREDTKTKDTPFFSHIFYVDGRVNSAFYEGIAVPIIRELEERTEKPYMDRLLRVKANLTYKQEGYPEGFYHTPHKDYDIPHEVMIYYVNDSDGDTLLFNEDPNEMFGFEEFTIHQRMTPRKGDTFFFNGRYYHAGVPPKITNARVVINFAFLQENTFLYRA